jgi:hypothetical protein
VRGRELDAEGNGLGRGRRAVGCNQDSLHLCLLQ